MRGGLTTAVGVLVLALAGCGGDDTPSSSSADESPSRSISTLTPLPVPSHGPPPGEIVADLRQSSRDAALNRFQVWIGNGLDREVSPTSIAYVDPRFRSPIPGERLRPNPSGSERGYPLTLPPRPDCGADGTSGEVTMTYGDLEVTVPVEVTALADVSRGRRGARRNPQRRFTAARMAPLCACRGAGHGARRLPRGR